MGNRKQEDRMQVWAEYTDRSEYFHLLTFQAKMFPIHSAISYQRLDSDLENITEKVNSTIQFTSEI